MLLYSSQAHATDLNPQLCRYLAGCRGVATGMAIHPVRGSVPACNSCAALSRSHGAASNPFESYPSLSLRALRGAAMKSNPKRRMSAAQKRALAKGRRRIMSATLSQRRAWALKARKTRKLKHDLENCLAGQRGSAFSVGASKPFEPSFEEEESVMPNPELLIVGNPGKKKSKKHKKCRSRCKRRGHRTIMYRGHRYYFISLLRKFGKGKARKIWRGKRFKACRKLLGRGKK